MKASHVLPVDISQSDSKDSNDVNKIEPDLIYNWQSIINKIVVNTISGKKYLSIYLEKALPVNNDFFWQTSTFLCLRNCQYGGIWRVHTIDSSKMIVHLRLDVFNSKSNNNCYDWEVHYIDEHQNMRIKPINIDESQPAYCFLSKPLIIHTRLLVFNVSKIETVEQSFNATVQFELRLRGISEIDDVAVVEELLKVYDIEKLIAFPNVNEDIKDEEKWNKFSISFIGENCFDYSFLIKKQANFAEKMELWMFPFDKQELSMRVQILKPHQSIKFINNEQWPSVFSKTAFQMDDIYRVVFGELLFHETTFTDPKESSSSISYPGIKYCMYLARRPNYYFSNVMIPSALFAMLSLLSLGVLEDGSKIDTGGRLSITLTLLLTSVAYKFVVASSLPQLSYTTLLDWYVWGNLIFILIVAVENVLYPLLVYIYGERISKAELIVLLVLVGLYAAANAIFGIWLSNTLRRREKIDERECKAEIQKRSAAKSIAKISR